MLWTVGPRTVLCLQQAGAHTRLEPQPLLQAAHSQTGAESGLRHKAADVVMEVTTLAEEEVGLRPWREEVQRLHQTEIFLRNKLFKTFKFKTVELTFNGLKAFKLLLKELITNLWLAIPL